MAGQILIVVAAVVILAVVLAAAMIGFDASAMSLNGWIALGLGTVFSLGLGVGLMALMFYSSRKGFDDRIERDTPEEDV